MRSMVLQRAKYTCLRGTQKQSYRELKSGRQCHDGTEGYKSKNIIETSENGYILQATEHTNIIIKKLLSAFGFYNDSVQNFDASAPV